MQQNVMAVSLAAALGMTSMQAQAVGFETLSSSGGLVLKVCQGVEDFAGNRETTDETGAPLAPNRCRVAGGLPLGTSCALASTFPGRPTSERWRLSAQRRNELLTTTDGAGQSVVFGTYDDVVWQRCVGPIPQQDYIFGVRVALTQTTWTEPANTNVPGVTNPSGDTRLDEDGNPIVNQGCNAEPDDEFEINDVYRSGFQNFTNITSAYRRATGEEGAWRSGRTNQGFAYLVGNGLLPTAQTARDNDIVNWRTDASPNDSDSSQNPNSAWLLMQVTGTLTPTFTPGTLTFEQGGEEGQCKFRFSVPGYRPQ